MTDTPLDIRLFGRSSLPCRTIVALGCFDGVHLAHRAILEAASVLAKQAEAAPGVFSFSRPPAFSFSGEAGQLLSDTDEKCAAFRAAGAAFAAVADFPALRELNAAEFIEEILIRRLHAVGVVCGFNFTYGRERSGNIGLLRQYFGSRALQVEAVTLNGAPVSSSRIRAALAAGDVEEAGELLGHPYSLTLPVGSGRHDGTRIGFPTLNQYPEGDKMLPAAGVYVTSVRLEDGRRLCAVSDVGLAPTLDRSGRIRIETHVLDRCPDLYGECVTVEFLRRLREERLFPDEAALAEQIRADTGAARSYFNTRGL